MRLRSASADQSAPPGLRPRSRVHISGISELSAGRDQQLGQIFRNMRVAMKVSREALARRLATTPLTIDNFEAGAINALPHWKETHRIVRGYCELLRLDSEPILWRIKSHLQSSHSHSAPVRSSTGPPPSPPPAILSRAPSGARNERPRERRRGVRALFAITAPVAVVAAIVFAAQSIPQPVYQALTFLPAPIAKPMRGALDYVVHMGAPTRDGLKWIELSDPQLRKSDKLQ
jgi:hypothetical protein